MNERERLMWDSSLIRSGMRGEDIRCIRISRRHFRRLIARGKRGTGTPFA